MWLQYHIAGNFGRVQIFVYFKFFENNNFEIFCLGIQSVLPCCLKRKFEFKYLVLEAFMNIWTTQLFPLCSNQGFRKLDMHFQLAQFSGFQELNGSALNLKGAGGLEGS